MLKQYVKLNNSFKVGYSDSEESKLTIAVRVVPASQ